MRYIIISFCTLLSVGAFTSRVQAQDARATQYAEEAVAAIQADFATAQRLREKGVVSSEDLSRRKLELIEAQILLARLKKDNDALTVRLQESLAVHEDLVAKYRALSKRGACSSHEVSAAELQALRAKLRLARQVHDEVAVADTLSRAIKLEQQNLDRIVALAKRGAANDRDIAAQKLRLAKLLATNAIEMDADSEQGVPPERR